MPFLTRFRPALPRAPSHHLSIAAIALIIAVTIAGVSGFFAEPQRADAWMTTTGANWKSTSAYTLDPADWVDTGATLPGNRQRASVAVIGDYVYLFGGGTTGGTNTIYRAPVSNPTSWTNTGSTLPGNLWRSQVALIGDYVYLFGGAHSATAATNIIYRAPLSNPTSWTNTGATLPAVLEDSQLAIIGDYAYLFGGSDHSSPSVNVMYRASLSDPTSWSNVGTLPGNLGSSQLAIIGDYVFLFGGSSNVIYRAPLSNPTSWTNTGSTLPDGIAGSQLAIIGDYVYLFGDYTGSYNVIYRAALSNPLAWIETGSTLPDELGRSQLAIIGDYAYLFGGIGGGAVTNIIYRAPLTGLTPGTAGTPTFTNVATSSMRVNWTAASGATSYKVERCSGVGCSTFSQIAGGVTDLFLDDTGLTPNTSYSYRVRATNTVGDGPYSGTGTQATDPVPQEGFPYAVCTAQSSFTTDTTAHNVAIPATATAGDLLLVLFTSDGGAAVTTPSGWTQLFTQNETNNRVRAGAYTRVADGSEGGTNVNFQTASNEQAAAQVYCIADWYGSIAEGVAVGTAIQATAANANPPPVTPPWGADKTLWFAYVGFSSASGAGVVTGYPANYTNGFVTSSSASTNGAQAASARRELNAAAEDPSAYTSASAAHAGNTIAIRPAAIGCTFNDQTVNHGASVTAYQSSVVPYGQSCLSEQRTCTNGTLSGSYQYATCTVDPTPPDPVVPITGWAWGEAYIDVNGNGFEDAADGQGGIGWISLDCSTGSATGDDICGTYNYGLRVNTSNGTISGHAWSDNYGWISANAADLAGCPSAPCTATLTSSALTGWLKVIAANDSQNGNWDGFIALSDMSTGDGINYGVSYANGNFGGFGWGSTNVGWVDFSLAQSQYNACTPSTVYTCSDPQTIARTDTNSSCQPTVTNTTCIAPQFCSTGSPVCLWPQPDGIPGPGGLTGNLQVRPNLVPKNGTSTIYWNLENVTNCTVTGTNGDVWSGESSAGASCTHYSTGCQSSPITRQTIFTLACTALDTSPYTETETVNLLPDFQEI